MHTMSLSERKSAFSRNVASIGYTLTVLYLFVVTVIDCWNYRTFLFYAVPSLHCRIPLYFTSAASGRDGVSCVLRLKYCDTPWTAGGRLECQRLIMRLTITVTDCRPQADSHVIIIHCTSLLGSYQTIILGDNSSNVKYMCSKLQPTRFFTKEKQN